MKYIKEGMAEGAEKFEAEDNDMKECRQLFQELITENLVQIICSNTRDADRAAKAKIRPVQIKEKLMFQETLYRGTQVFHSNFTREEMVDRLSGYMETLFRQAEITCDGERVTVLVSKKGTVTVKRKKTEAQAAPQKELAHNRTKQYILPEGNPVDFLIGLGVQTPDGHIAKARYDKFRQINRYLEFIEDILDKLPSDRRIRIIDFGCGKSYLTFAMYYYLKQVQGREIQVTGLDLKRDVIEHCNALAEKLQYTDLHFEYGDIQNYEGETAVDMVVSLHACDKATDYALEKAVKWGASVILAVPCCQHELNRQIKCDTLEPVFRYGVIKERMAALITDALRADMLEQQGYSTRILEFIDMEHTPKNLLIRAVKDNRMKKRGASDGAGEAAVQRVREFLNVEPTLGKLLRDR